ncbi:MAG: hypothetical protein ACKVU4_06925 [Phycisphaerales bacterium]
MTRRRSLRKPFLFGGAILAAALAVGCEEKKKEEPPPSPPPKQQVVIPDRIEMKALLQELNSDARVQFPDAAAPTDRALAEGVIMLANAIAKGDSGAMRPLLDRAGQAVLDDLVGTGGWDDATKKIEAVRVVRLNQLGYDRPSASVATAIQEPGGAYVLLWAAKPDGDAYIFSPQLAAAGVKARASEWDSAQVDGQLSLLDGADLGDLSGGLPPGMDPKEIEEQLRDAMRRNTPAGPITVPNPSGPGGG